MAFNEFTLIQHYFSDISFSNPHILLGVGDDGASISIPTDHELVFSIDTQLAGVHFPANANSEWVAQRVFRCAVSDLAAMGADPLCFTLALTLPDPNEIWLQAFSTGLKQVATEFQCSLVGGDTTRGPLSITLQVHGTLPKQTSLKRSGAQVGDVILTSGYLGGAAAYVEMINTQQLDKKEHAHMQELFQQDYFFPTSCIALGQALRNIAHCAIDVSDGLLADLQHLCIASEVNAELHLARLPTRLELNFFGADKAIELAARGGDDYQLCFTVAESATRNLMKTSEALEIPLTMIGKINDTSFDAEQPVTCYDRNGNTVETGFFNKIGYTHF